MSLNRRTFVKSTVAASALALPAVSYARIVGSNEMVRVGVVGLNGRGQSHMDGFLKNLVAVCDCDKKVLGERQAKWEKKLGRKLEAFVDYRKLVEDKNIDAIGIATPNHTHSIIGIAAVANGKDVYCEKPISQNVWEGRQLVNAARKYKRIVQCGTQSRSSQSLKDAVQYVRDGNLGKIKYAIGTCYKPRPSIGKLDQPLSIPSHIDYDLWCGPAEKVSLYRPRLHYDWHWDFNTGNGDMGNQGIHQMDIARWFLGETTIAPRTLSIGGRLGYVDAGDTPNTQTVIHDYENAPLIFETRGLPKDKESQKAGWGQNMDNYRGSRIGVIVQCENGYVVIPSYSSAKAFGNDDVELKSWSGGGNHYDNFLAAVDSRDPRDLNAEILEGHLSSALCHTGGVSHRAGRRATLDEIRTALGDNVVFMDSFERMAKHLSRNNVAMNGTALTLGADLKFDTKSEIVIENEKANQMMTREFRKPFEVNEISLA